MTIFDGHSFRKRDCLEWIMLTTNIESLPLDQEEEVLKMVKKNC